MSNNDELVTSLEPLVKDGTLTAVQRDAVVQRLQEAKVIEGPKSFKNLVSEALLYLGGAIIFGSGALLISQTWDDLGRWGRPGVLVAAAIALWIAGIIIQGKKPDEEGRRLTSTLLSGGAALVGFAANNVLRELWVPKNAQGFEDWMKTPYWVDPAQILISTSLVCLFAVFGYRIAASALSLAVIGGSALGVSISLGQLINYLLGPETPRDQFFEAPLPWLTSTFTILGSAVWLWLWMRGVFQEKVVAHLLGLGGVFIGINMLREHYDEDVTSLSLILFGLVGLWLYVRRHQWPYLAVGMASILMGGIQLLFTHVEGVGGAMGSMALGAVLVVVGIRLVTEKPEGKTQ